MAAPLLGAALPRHRRRRRRRRRRASPLHPQERLPGGLVHRPADWPGVSCVRALVAADELRGTWLDRTAEFEARRRGKRVVPGQFASSYTVKLSPLPSWQGLSQAQHRAACADLVAQIEADTTAARAQAGRASVGRDRVLAQHPHDRPVSSDTSAAPLVHSSSLDTWKAFRWAYAAFVDAFRAADACLRKGIAASFPVGAFPPGAPFVATAPPPIATAAPT